MDSQNKFWTPTGRTFENSEIEFGHRKGKFCLTCGIYCNTLCCDSCVLLSKCKLCGIVCKVHPTNKVYSYVKTPNKKVCKEMYQEVHTICQKLESSEYGDLCEHCLSWEKRMQHKCFLCKTFFENSFRYFKEKGNCCNFCYTDIITSLKTKKLSTV